MKKTAGFLGLSACVLFLIALCIFGTLNPTFDFLQDYVSKLGAQGEPYALGWNIVGFVVVGLLLMGFGIAYGKILNDQLLGILLSLFGLLFAGTAIPIDMEASDTPISKAHVVAICLALACWLFGLARIGANHALDKKLRRRANIAAILLLSAMLGAVAEIWSMPVTHRLVFSVVFGWTGITAFRLWNEKLRSQSS